MIKNQHLSNGLKFVTLEQPHLHSAGISLWWLCVSRHENDAQAGYSHLLEHSLFQGTQKHSGKSLAECFEGWGGLVNGFASRELTVLHGLVPGENARDLAQQLVEMLMEPLLAGEAVARERSVVLTEMRETPS